MRCTNYISEIMSDPRYELSVNILGALNILCIGLKDLQTESQNGIKIWMTIQVFINALFFIELVIDFLIHRSQSFKKSFRVWPETLCQLINIYATTLFVMNFSRLSKVLEGVETAGSFDTNNLIKLYEVIIFIRILKVLTLLYELKAMRLVIETMRNMIVPLM